MPAIAVLVVLGLALNGTWRAFRDGSNRIEDWLPRGFQEARELQWFRQHFGGDSFLMISWEGCELVPQREETDSSEPPSLMSKFSEALRQASVGPGHEPFFSQVITGEDALNRLTNMSLGISRAEAIDRLKGWMFGADGKTSCIVVVMSDAGLQMDREAIDAVNRAANQSLAPSGISLEKLHIAGPAIEALEIESSSHKFLIPLNTACYVVCSLLMLLTFRSFIVTGLIVTNAILCQLLFLAVVGYSPWCKLDSIMLIAPSLMFVLAVSCAVHLVGYFRDAVSLHGHAQAPWQTLRMAAAPSLFSALTTAIGLMSLMISMLVPVQNFGIYSAIGVMLSLVLLSTLPWQLERFVPASWAQQQVDEHQRYSRLSQLAAIGISYRVWPVLMMTLLIFVVGISGLLQIRAKIRIHDYFLPGSKLVQDYAWLEERIGPLAPIEIVLRLTNGSRLPLTEQLLITEEIQQVVAGTPGINTTASALNFAPKLDTLRQSSLRGVAQRTLLSKRVEEIRETLIDLGFLRVLDTDYLWRISARVFSADKIDYSALIEEMKLRVHSRISQVAGADPTKLEIAITGGVPVLQKAQDQMLADLISSFICSLFLILGAIILLFFYWAWMDQRPTGIMGLVKSIIICIAAGMLAMIPNVLPVIVVFGAIGLMGINVGMGSMLTATVAMGIAVDDTLHYLTWYHRSRRSGKSRKASVAAAFEQCAKAMLQTTAIFVFGLAVFTLSPYLPSARYAAIMCSMLFIGLIGDLVVLPAILLSPLGRALDLGNSRRG